MRVTLRSRETSKCFRSTSRCFAVGRSLQSFSKKEDLAGRGFRAILKKGRANYFASKMHTHVREHLSRGSTSLFISHLKKRDKKSKAVFAEDDDDVARCDLKEHTPYIRRAVVMDKGYHKDDGRCARARGTLVSHLVRFHRQKCRRRICSFRHDAVAVDHPYCSPRESGSQTASRKG